MAFSTTNPIVIPIQATQPRGEVSALAVDQDELSGSKRIADALNHLLLNHTGLQGAVAFIPSSDGALTTNARALRFRFNTPWRYGLVSGSTSIAVWIYAVRATNGATWTINLASSVTTLTAVNVQGGAVATGWWFAGNLRVNDVAGADAIAIAVNTFTEAAPANRIEAIALIPPRASSFNNSQTLSNMGRTMAPLDLDMFDGEEAQSSFLLQWAEAIVRKVERRNGMALTSAQAFTSAVGVLSEFTIIVIDDVPARCESVTIRFFARYNTGAATTFIRLTGETDITPTSGTNAVYSKTIAVERGVERVLVLSGENVTIEDFSVQYDEGPL